MNVRDIAKVCHEVNRAYCEAIGDETQLAWDVAPDWQRQSAIDGVMHAIEHPDDTPESQHEEWMIGKLAAGWVYGEVKDAEAKTHPCLVPYEQLPAEQRVKDHLFLAVVRAMENVAG